MPNATVFARRCARCFVLLAACSLLSGNPASADEPKIDPAARKVVDAFGKYFAGLKGFHLTADVAVKVESQGQKQTQEFKQDFSARRPNELSYVLDSPAIGATVVSDGKDLSLFIEGYGKYATEKAPATLDDILKIELVFGIVGLGNAANVTAALLSDDPAARLLEKIESLEYGGVVDLEGVKCHLLKATADPIDWQIWIDAGKEPLVRKFVPDLEKAFAKLAKARQQKSPFENMKITNTVTYKDWEIDPKFPADAFAFTVPEGATKVDSFAEIVGQPAAEPQPHALLGKPAPPIELELLDGGTLDLASFKDKNVVILDFWATWCGPCAQAMPIIDKVAEKFKDRGVRLFAVNLQEGVDEIRTFLDEAKLDVPVALDTEGAVAAAYMANAIPQTVLVGKDGTVQVVRIGLSPDLEDALSKELEALLAGKNLAAEELAKARKKAEEKARAAEAPTDGDPPSKDAAPAK
jgi:thiol-disulfide isomerase/thioredoxin